MPQTSGLSASALGPPRPAPAPAEAPGSEFSPLLREVRGQGLLEHRTGWYARTITLNLLALAAVLTGLALLGESWWALLLAPPLAVLSARTAFVGHDAGHSQITADRRLARLIGLVHGNLLLGMGYAWWNEKHNRHHANPNHTGKDPDVAADVLVFTAHQAVTRTGFRAWLTRHQAGLFLPLTLLEGIALKVYGFQDLRNHPWRVRLVEGGLLTAHVAGYTALLLTLLTPGRRSPSPPSTRHSSGSISAWPSPPTTRAWRCPTRKDPAGDTCAARC